MLAPNRLTLLLLLISAVFSLGSGAEGVPAAPDDADQPALALQARHPEMALPYVGIDVELTMTNRGEEPLALVDFPWPPHLQVEVHAGETIIYRGPVFMPLALEERLPGAPAVLDAGESRSFQATLRSTYIYSNMPVQPLFQAPGPYRIRFIYPVVYRTDLDSEMRVPMEGDMREALVSEWQDIRIDLPREHQQAFDALLWLRRPLWILEPDAALMSVRRDSPLLQQWDDQLAEYLADHPDAPWAAYAWHARARVHASRGMDRSIDEPEREAYSRRAAEIYEQAAEAADAHELRGLQREALNSAQWLWRRLGDDERATELLYKARELGGTR